jgi:hypothetical protein
MGSDDWSVNEVMEINALFGLNNHYSAVVPTMVAQTFFRPRVEPAVAFALEQRMNPTGPAATDHIATREKSPRAPREP